MPLLRSARGRTAICLTTVAGAIALAAVVPTTASAAQPRHRLEGSRPNWVAKARPVQDTKASTTVSFGVLLSMRNAAGAAAAVQRISDPSSADYGHYLNAAQFNARYAPSATTVRSVRDWMRSQGFTIRKTLRSGMYLELEGTAAQIEKTFGTSLKQYRYQGQTVRGNATTLSLPASAPAAVVSAVRGVIGVDQGSALKQPAETEPGPAPGSRYGVYTQPCSKYFRQKIAYNKPKAYGKYQPYASCGYSPKQLQSAYGITPLLKHGINGRGVTVAITDAYASPTIVKDANKYNAYYGLRAFSRGQFSQLIPGPNDFTNVDKCGASGWYGEETLDVEAVHTMAPGANIVYVGATDCLSGLEEAWAETIDSHVADIVTNSWGDGVDTVALLGQDYIDFYQQFSIEAALTGITVNFSTGDHGDQTSGGTDLASKSLSFPSDLPYVTAVGGTSIFIGKHGQYVKEYGWQTAYSALSDDGKSWTMPPTYAAGGGGGTSQLFGQPFYQRGVVPRSVSTYYGSTPMRSTPDISMDGDSNSGFIVGQTQEFPDGTYWDRYRIGGTSVSSPLMAGVDALAGQVAGQPIGFANPLYYRLNRTSAVHDVVAPKHPVAQVRTDFANFLDASQGYLYRLATVDVQTSTIHTARGWDAETGVGTPNGLKFVASVAALTYHR